ncbi:ATP-binding protein [Motilibacter peucedani]|uniref:ATP-binding protein n=1 Tax=Motilibacter peucedani TaxID=598650 RepID=UPI0015FF441F|nr:ATP-binding protein [Motilibacter peucedani]
MQLVLAPRTDSGAVARRFLRAATCADHPGAMLDDAALLVSEVVANAVRHGAPPIVLSVECLSARELEVAVRDGSPTDPLPRVASELDESGRGMALVAALSESWGTRHDATGKQVWFRVRKTA